MSRNKRRWRNGLGYKSQKYFYRAIEKYGWDNFKHEILYENLEKEQAKVLEMSLIHYYNSTNPKFGYNLTKGGEGHFGYCPTEETRKKLSEAHKGKTPWNKGKTDVFSEESKKKMSEASKGRRLSDESKKKISEANKGNKRTEEERKKISEKAKERYENRENHPMYGKHHTEEAKQKMSEAKKGRSFSEEHKQKLSDASKGKRVGENNPMYGKKGKNNCNSKTIICLTTNRIFYSITEASEYYKCERRNISSCCNGKIKSAGKYNGKRLIWRYITIVEL